MFMWRKSFNFKEWPQKAAHIMTPPLLCFIIGIQLPVPTGLFTYVHFTLKTTESA